MIRASFIAALLLCSPSARATTTIISGETDTADTYMSSGQPDGNFGGWTDWVHGVGGGAPTLYHGLLNYNESVFPPNITAATLTCIRESNAGAANANTLNFHRLLIGFSEGVSTGGANDGETTWNYRVEPSTAWPGSAGGSTSGTDYNASVAFSYAYSALPSGDDIQEDITVPVSEVEAIRDGTNTYGWLTKASNEATSNSLFLCHSSSAAAANRPYMTITWTPYAPLIGHMHPE